MRLKPYAPTALLVLSACTPAQNTTAPGETNAVLEVVVANQQSASASILNADGATVRNIAVGQGPHEAAISADGRLAVLTIYGAQQPGNQLAVIDLVRDSVIRVIDLGQYRRPHGAVFISDAPQRVAVTSEATQFVVVVNIEDGTIEKAIPTQAHGSHMVAVTADGKFGYTANIADNNVSELDLTTGAFMRKVAVPVMPEGVAVTPDGREVWVGSNATGEVSVISTATGAITHTLAGIVFPYRLNNSADGKLMAIVDGKGDKVHIASVAEHRLIGSVALNQPRGVVFGPEDKRIYVTLGEGALVVVDVATMRVLQTIGVQASPDGVAVRLRR